MLSILYFLYLNYHQLNDGYLNYVPLFGGIPAQASQCDIFNLNDCALSEPYPTFGSQH